MSEKKCNGRKAQKTYRLPDDGRFMKKWTLSCTEEWHQDRWSGCCLSLPLLDIWKYLPRKYQILEWLDTRKNESSIMISEGTDGWPAFLWYVAIVFYIWWLKYRQRMIKWKWSDDWWLYGLSSSVLPPLTSAGSRVQNRGSWLIESFVPKFYSWWTQIATSCGFIAREKGVGPAVFMNKGKLCFTFGHSELLPWLSSSFRDEAFQCKAVQAAPAAVNFSYTPSTLFFTLNEWKMRNFEFLGFIRTF